MEHLSEHLAVLWPQNSDPAVTWPNSAVYALFDERALVLIDAGNGRSVESVWADLQSLGVLNRPEKAVLLTHCHLDHSGGARPLSAQFTVYGSEQTAEILRERPAEVLYEQPELVEPLDLHAFAPGAVLGFGGIQVATYPLPGHTGDSVAYAATVDGQRCLFTGDLMMVNGDLGWTGSVDFSREKSRESVAWVAAREFDLWLTGHGYLRAEEARRVLAEGLRGIA